MKSYGVVAVVLLAPVLIMLGCAKRPATVVTAAPAPPSTTISPGSPQPMPRSETRPPASDQRGGAAVSGARPSPNEFVAVRDLVDIHFDFDKSVIRPRDAEILDANARWLRANNDALVLIEGHCDERGTGDYNLALGERRAKATVDYLVAQGIAAARMTTITYGKERPQCTDHNEACWAKNRRAHFLMKRG